MMVNTNDINEVLLQHLQAATTSEASNNKPAGKPIVIADECGDSLWDAVLEQEYPVLKYPEIIS